MAQAEHDGGTTYIQLLLDVMPLLIIAFGLLVIRGLAYIRKSYLHRSFLDILCNVLFSSAVMAAFAVGVVLCLPLLGVEMTPTAELGLTVFLSAGGMKMFDAIIRKRFGLHVVDFRDGEFFQALYNLVPKNVWDEHHERHLKNREASEGDDDADNEKTTGT